MTALAIICATVAALILFRWARFLAYVSILATAMLFVRGCQDFGAHAQPAPIVQCRIGSFAQVMPDFACNGLMSGAKKLTSDATTIMTCAQEMGRYVADPGLLASYFACKDAYTAMLVERSTNRSNAPPTPNNQAAAAFRQNGFADIAAGDIGSAQMLDLSGTGRPYLLASLSNSKWCGTGGCTFALFEPPAPGAWSNAWRKINEWSATDVRAGGGIRGEWLVLVVSGRSGDETWEHTANGYVGPDGKLGQYGEPSD